jgi:GT2 family glycosyltransferase
MSHRLPIVSALYHQKFPEWNGTEVVYRPVMLKVESDGQARHIIDYKPGSLVEVDMVGAGALLVHRSVFERLQNIGIKRFFEWTMHADSGENPGFSEDFEFCVRCRQNGYKVLVDTSLVCMHETTAMVTTRGLQFKL